MEHDLELARERAEFAAYCRLRGECIEWIGNTHSGTERPIWRWGSRNAISARRWLWKDEGRPLEDGEYLKPSCGNSSCISPHHSYIAGR